MSHDAILFSLRPDAADRRDAARLFGGSGLFQWLGDDMSEDKCDCTVNCGDDPRIKSGSVERCEWAKKRATHASAAAGPSDAEFEAWLRTKCFQKPTPQAYDLARDAYRHAAALTSAPAEPQRNQCDGCNARAPINKFGHHKYADGSLIACTADRYQCVCGHPSAVGVTHRNDGPCFLENTHQDYNPAKPTPPAAGAIDARGQEVARKVYPLVAMAEKCGGRATSYGPLSGPNVSMAEGDLERFVYACGRAIALDRDALASREQPINASWDRKTGTSLNPANTTPKADPDANEISALRWLLNITTEFDRKDVRTRQAARLLDDYSVEGKTNREHLESLWGKLASAPRPEAPAAAGAAQAVDKADAIRFMNLELDIRRVLNWEPPINGFDIVKELQVAIEGFATASCAAQAVAEALTWIERAARDVRNHVLVDREMAIIRTALASREEDASRKVIGYTWTQAGGKHRSVGAAPHPTNAHNIEPIYYPFATPTAATPAAPGEVTQEAVTLLGKYKKLCAEIGRGDGYHLSRIERAIAALSHPTPVRCKGKNCGTTTGDHSPECVAEHESAYSSGGGLDTPGNREPESRYRGYKGQPLDSTASADQHAAWDEGNRAALAQAAPVAAPAQTNQEKQCIPTSSDGITPSSACAGIAGGPPSATTSTDTQTRDAWRGGSSYEASMLRNLLARIHGDGGHYLEQHGLDKALEDADLKVANWRAAPAPASEAVAQGLPYGIIDPDYARVFTMARIIAWQYGYAIALQGSFTRDLDLLMVPWTDRACDAAPVVARIADVAGLTPNGEPGAKPHGRLAWNLLFPGFSDPRWVDISVFPRVATPGDSADAPVQQAPTEQELFDIIRGTGFVTRGQAWDLVELVRAALKGEQPVEPSGGERGEV